MNELELALQRWANFYVIMSAAAATLIGLLFVVITLAAGADEPEATAEIHVYLTPTAICYAAVLGVAALLSFPNHTRLTAALCICLVGVAGLVYSGSLLVGANRKSYYERVDLIIYADLPFAAFGLLVLGGVLVLHDTELGLTLVAIGMVSLLAVAIRNSWAMALGVVVSSRPGRH